MDTLLPARDTALLVVDIQEKLVPAMHAEAAARVSRNVQNLLHAAAACEVPVLATEQYPRGLGPTLPDIRAALDVAHAPAAIAKETFSALRHADVAAWLNAQKKRRVVLVGMEAHVCVYLTARDLLQDGFLVHVPHDAVASRREEDRLAALDLCRQAGAAVTTTETILFDWLGTSTHAAFRDISRRIR